MRVWWRQVSYNLGICNGSLILTTSPPPWHQAMSYLCSLPFSVWHRVLLKHNSDMRDSYEYTQKQVWGAQIYTRQRSRGFKYLEIRLNEALALFAMIPIHIFRNNLCTLGCRPNLSCDRVHARIHLRGNQQTILSPIGNNLKCTLRC